MAGLNSRRSQPGDELTSARTAQEGPEETAIQQASGSEIRGEDGFQAVVELAPDAIIIANASGRIVLVNRQTELLFGYDRAHLLGFSVEILIPERFQSSHILHRASYGANSSVRTMGSGLQLVGRRQDGGEFPVEISLSPLNAAGEPLVIATVRDISELKRTEAARVALEAASQELRQLLALTDTALSNLALEDLLRALLARALDVMNVDNAAILLLDEGGQELRVRAARGLEEDVAAQVRVPVGEGFAGRIMATRAPLVVDDIHNFPVVSAILRERLRSAVGVPLLAGERLLGVLHVGSAIPRHFGDQDIRMLQLVSERIALAIDRTRLHEATLAARAEAARERARWQAVIDAAPAFVITCDADLRLTYINPAYTRLLGSLFDPSSPFEEWPARWGLLAPDGSGPVAFDQTPLARTLHEQRVVHGIELLYQELETGEERLLRWDGAPMRAGDSSLLGAVCVGWDITEQRRLEREAHDRSAQLEAIFEAVTDGIVVYDTDGHVIMRNAVARAQYSRLNPNAPGVTLQEVYEQLWPTDEFGREFPEAQWVAVRALRGEVITGDHPVEMHIRAPDGARVIFRATAAPLRDAEGAIIGSVSVTHDATARKRLEREREESRARELAALEVSHRLEEFFTIAAHDIRNPVTTAYISVQALQRRIKRLREAFESGELGVQTEAIDALDKGLRFSRSSVERLIRLIDRLFDIAQARAGKLELKLASCDLAAIAREQVAAQQAAETERVIQLEAPDDLRIPVRADADRIGEVLANFLTNAHKYSAIDRPVIVRLDVSEGQGMVAVQDEGPGLPPAEQALIWEMFHRAAGVKALNKDVSQRNAGLGLGLHICKRLIETHPGGEVGVKSEVGRGSTFWFSLPLADGAAPTDAG